MSDTIQTLFNRVYSVTTRMEIMAICATDGDVPPTTLQTTPIWPECRITMEAAHVSTFKKTKKELSPKDRIDPLAIL